VTKETAQREKQTLDPAASGIAKRGWAAVGALLRRRDGRLVAAGRSDKEIATELGISPLTGETKRSRSGARGVREKRYRAT
jgi:FixJ family two-component response regulator